jgi:hypothetical protein
MILFHLNITEITIMHFSFQAQVLTTILTTRATLQLRFVIPNGVSPESTFFFPFF